MPDPKSVGIWLRVSTEDQVKGESPQHHEARAHALSRGWNVATVYNLGGFSGKTVKDHAECKRMMADVRSGAISALVFS
jgi:site-specific DNA recombinase